MPTDASRVVLLDVDGTLVDYEGTMPASARTAVREAHANGHRIFLCTGRSLAEITPDLRDLLIEGVIGGNGSYFERSGQLIYEETLPADLVRRATDWLAARESGYILECNTGLIASNNFSQKAADALGWVDPDGPSRVRTLFPGVLTGPTTTGRPNTISFVLEAGLDLNSLASHLGSEVVVGTWSLTGSCAQLGQISPADITKAESARALAGYLGVPLESFVAIGDAASDLKLLACCGTGVAMGNAPAAAREAANLVTGHVNDDGLARAFEELQLVGAEPSGRQVRADAVDRMEAGRSVCERLARGSRP